MSQEPEKAVSPTTKAYSALGVIASIGLAVLVNVGAARNYKRWDLTSAQLYTLSEPTKTTLRGLGEPVEIYVLLSQSDALLTSVRHMMVSYAAETTKLKISYVDPDRSPAEFLALKEKYGIVAGRTEDGRVVADASVLVVKGDKRWFLTSSDLVDSSEENEGRARPRLEQGFTTAIRNVLNGERDKICFAKGHGELGADEPGARGLSELKFRLVKNNSDTQIVDLSAQEPPKDPWKGCSLVYIAGPQTPWNEREAKELSAYLDGGGSVMMLINPVVDTGNKRVVASGLESVAAKGGIELRQDLVLEKDKAHRPPQGIGETFLGSAKEHAISHALTDEKNPNVRLVFVLAQSLGKISASPVQPSELITTSAQSFAVTDFLREEPPAEKRNQDRGGPLAVAMAAELPKPPGKDAPHGPRMVVVGSSTLSQGQNWQEPGLRAGAYFVESAVAWLTARPQIVDIPQKPEVQAGMRLDEKSQTDIRTYVTVYVPTAVGLLGLAVFLRRRSTEKRKDAGERRRSS